MKQSFWQGGQNDSQIEVAQMCGELLDPSSQTDHPNKPEKIFFSKNRCHVI